MSELAVLKAVQGDHRYEVRVGGGATSAVAALSEARDCVALVSCKTVLATPFGAKVAGAVRRGGRGVVVTVPDGEAGKTLSQLERSASALLGAGATRRSLVVALGGGAVTDAAGFLAATYMRGIDWAAVPTTLLGMVDAAIGGKTAANLRQAKNAVGAFHPPLVVLADPVALRTLPPREQASGMGEVLKYAALRPELLAVVSRAARARRASNELVAACVRIKLEVVERDPTEQGERKLLNLGHTFGHGVEAAGGFSKYTHGEAVGMGLAFAFRLALRLGRVDASAVKAIDAALDAAGLPKSLPAPLARRAAALMRHDKKRTAAGLLWVLPRGTGRTWNVEWDVQAHDDAVQETVKEVSAP